MKRIKIWHGVAPAHITRHLIDHLEKDDGLAVARQAGYRASRGQNKESQGKAQNVNVP